VSLLDDATLEGGLVRVQLGDAIAQASENLSIDGAPTVRMTLLDPARELLGSQLWQQRSRLALGERRYVLVQTDKQAGGLLQLTFEQWESYVLRQARGYGQKADTARRKTITRASSSTPPRPARPSPSSRAPGPPPPAPAPPRPRPARASAPPPRRRSRLAGTEAPRSPGCRRRP
jgi:hypothetical protein